MKKIDLENYSPSKEQEKRFETLLKISAEAQRQNFIVWVFGGYGLDILYGKLTRDHRDFDLYIEKASEKKFIKIIEKIGFYATPERVGKVEKVVYKNDNFSLDFRLEYGTLEKIKKIAPKENLNLFFPRESLGRLEGQSIWTPTIEGFKRIIKMNNQLAVENNWEKYPYQEWQDEIMKKLADF